MSWAAKYFDADEAGCEDEKREHRKTAKFFTDGRLLPTACNAAPKPPIDSNSGKGYRCYGPIDIENGVYWRYGVL